MGGRRQISLSPGPCTFRVEPSKDLESSSICWSGRVVIVPPITKVVVGGGRILIRIREHISILYFKS